VTVSTSVRSSDVSSGIALYARNVTTPKRSLFRTVRSREKYKPKYLSGLSLALATVVVCALGVFSPERSLAYILDLDEPIIDVGIEPGGDPGGGGTGNAGADVGQALVVASTKQIAARSEKTPMPDLTSVAQAIAASGTPEEAMQAVPPEFLDSYPELFPAAGFSDASVSALTTTQTGIVVAPCPSGGGNLLAPGFPAPYGAYVPNTLNNWCMPNSVTNGCNVIPDRTPVYDFGAACRQHDLAYRWKPVSSWSRMLVEAALLGDALDDCAYRTGASKRACQIAASVMVTATILFGDIVYGRDDTPGYSTGPLQIDPAVLDTGGYCAQPSYAKLYVGEFSTRIVRGVPVYPTGVGKAFSRMRFRFFNANDNLVTEHTTRAADRGCVVRHERERFSSSVLPAGRYRVEVTFVPFGSNQLEVRTLWLETIERTSNTWCNQSSHPVVWIPGGEPARVGALVYLSGIVRPSTRVAYNLVSSAGSIVLSHTTRPAASNCVIAHEPEARYLHVPPGTYTLRATYTEWETNQQYTADRNLIVWSNTNGLTSAAPSTPTTQKSTAPVTTMPTSSSQTMKPLSVQSAIAAATTTAIPSLPVGTTPAATTQPTTTPPTTTPPTTTPPITTPPITAPSTTATPSETKAPPTTATPPVTKVPPTTSTPTTTTATTIPVTKTTSVPGTKPASLGKPAGRATDSSISAETEKEETIESKV
jgi:hypothetical protein